VAPLSFRNRHAATAQKFDSFIAHEEIASYVPDFALSGEKQGRVE
jgi:hypothetical protein